VLYRKAETQKAKKEQESCVDCTEEKEAKGIFKNWSRICDFGISRKLSVVKALCQVRFGSIQNARIELTQRYGQALLVRGQIISLELSRKRLPDF